MLGKRGDVVRGWAVVRDREGELEGGEFKGSEGMG